MKIHKNLFLSLILLFSISSYSYSQVDKQKIKEAGFSYFSIKDNVNDIDSVRFIASGSLIEKKAMLLFIQGSGNQPIIFYDDTSSFPITISSIPPQFYEKYHIVIISKPGIPVCLPYSENQNFMNQNSGDYHTFIRHNNLDYYVESANQVIDYLSTFQFIDTQHIFVVGHSQGYPVIAKLTALYPEKIKKAVCMSSSPFDRQSGFIRAIRLKQEMGLITSELAQNKIDSLYERYNYIKNGYEELLKQKSYDSMNFYHFKNDYSFNFDPPINYMLKINTPLLVVYGTKDPVSYDNDLLPLFFSRANKSNLTIKCYPNYDHNYVCRQYDNDGNIVKTEYNWFKVFEDIDIWLNN
ncbi:MAG: hypothetical protein A2033_05540 [Bacteroidetes bacterium GWA2_31_9]|nr:MAG: hypothetical protein A2033_05540 [Bacteroidetes bacterium GWA2_31_9]